MKRAEKAERIRKVLDRIYPKTEIPLEHENPYTLLIAVVLSAQCTDVTATNPGRSRHRSQIPPAREITSCRFRCHLLFKTQPPSFPQTMGKH